MPVSLSMYQQATWREETHLICARGGLVQFHACVARHVAAMACMSCSSIEWRPCNKHQQAQRMSQRPCPLHAPHSASRLLHRYAQCAQGPGVPNMFVEPLVQYEQRGDALRARDGKELER